LLIFFLVFCLQGGTSGFHLIFPNCRSYEVDVKNDLCWFFQDFHVILNNKNTFSKNVSYLFKFFTELQWLKFKLHTNFKKFQPFLRYVQHLNVFNVCRCCSIKHIVLKFNREHNTRFTIFFHNTEHFDKQIIFFIFIHCYCFVLFCVVFFWHNSSKNY